MKSLVFFSVHMLTVLLLVIHEREKTNSTLLEKETFRNLMTTPLNWNSLKSELMTLPHPWCSAMTRQYRFIDWFCVDKLYNLIEVLVLGNYVLWNILFFIPQAVLAQWRNWSEKWKSFTISIIKLQREWISFKRLFKVACFKFNYNNFNFCYFLLSFWWNIFLVIEMLIIII